MMLIVNFSGALDVLRTAAAPAFNGGCSFIANRFVWSEVARPMPLDFEDQYALYI